MILHRLRLTNFRGVADREIAFPDQGVVVVCGPNEIGKSSMLEALDLLIAHKDRAANQKVKAVKPANADVGAEVEAEISTGPYRFVYRKRFHKKTMTELEIIEPKRENLSADEAHERVAAILAETLDIQLWDAQRVLQSASTDAVKLSGSDALSRALDAAAGATETTSAGGESLLIDRIEAEFLKYFTGTGRPTGVWKAAIERVKAADAESGRARLALEGVDERVSRHEALTADIRELEAALTPAAARLTGARTAYEALTRLGEQLGQARLVAAAATATATNSELADAARRQSIAGTERRSQALAGLQTALVEAEKQEAAARETAGTASAAAEKAVAALQVAQQRLGAARAAAEAGKLATKVAGIDEIDTELARIADELDAIALTGAALADIEAHWAAVQRLAVQLQAVAATVEFTAPAGLDIIVDGETHTLAAGQTWAQPASAPVTVDVPGVLRVRIDPGASTVELCADLDAAQQLLDRQLAAAGVSDVEAARAQDARRRTLAESRATLSAKRDGLCAGEDIAELRSRLAELRAAADDRIDPEAADEAVRAARADADTRQQEAVAAAESHAEKLTEATLVRERLTVADTEFVTVRDQLATVRAAVTDEAVAAQARSDAEAQRVADQAVAALAERYDAADPAAVDAELAAAVQAVDDITADRDAAAAELNNLTIELGVISGEGRQGRLDEAQAELERARAEQIRIGERAAAAQLLRSTMIRHRDNARQRYVQPYRTELERLGRPVFGDDFEVDVDTELTIQTRTLDGCTVPYDSLSGGAREQLGILARLAGAALVAKEDTVPVIIDDALGFSDPDRLAKMGAVLNTVGGHGQVIVLTCTPGRYAGVADAEVIELST